MEKILKHGFFCKDGKSMPFEEFFSLNEMIDKAYKEEDIESIFKEREIDKDIIENGSWV